MNKDDIQDIVNSDAIQELISEGVVENVYR